MYCTNHMRITFSYISIQMKE